MLNVRISQDLFAAIIFMLIGASALFFGADLDAGTSAEMGPGYLPRALGVIVLGLGGLIALRSIWVRSPAVGQISLRPICLILAACAAFALLVDTAGFVLASAAAIFIALFAMGRPTLLYTLGMVIVLPAALALVFVVGLGLSIDLWWF
jgi:hypothetical protein